MGWDHVAVLSTVVGGDVSGRYMSSKQTLEERVGLALHWSGDDCYRQSPLGKNSCVWAWPRRHGRGGGF